MPRGGQGLFPFRSPAKFREGDSIQSVLSNDSPNILRLKGAAADRILETTITMTKTSDVFSVLDLLKAWFPECGEDFLEVNTNPEFKLNNIINNWFQQRGKPQAACKTMESCVKRTFRFQWELEGFMFITTESDRYGFVLGEAREGELVFVAYGSGHPFVLRRDDTHEDSYTLVGCAIVDELMDGEAFEMMEAGTLKEQVILLR